MCVSVQWQLLIGAMGVMIFMALLWIVQWHRRDAGIVDVGWAASLGALALWYAASGIETVPSAENTVRRWVVAGLGAGWGFRLALYLLRDRVWKKPHEDGRYQFLREYWGAQAQPYFFLFFQAQALLAILFSIPFLLAMQAPRSGMNGCDVAGIMIWLMSVGGESLADWQLAWFRAEPENKGKTCRVGLWGVSRHPNYFFEWWHWWAWVCLAVGHPWWWLTLLGPVLMLLFLFRVTGIPYTEAQAVRSRGDDYRRYQREVSPFIPWFPKST